MEEHEIDQPNKNDTKKLLLDVREIIEKFLIHNTDENNYESAINSLEKEYEVIENSLSTLLNYLALQQNVLRSFRNIEQFTRKSLLEDRSPDQINKTLRIIMLPQFEVLFSNISTVFKSSDRVLLYADNPDIPGGVSDKIREIRNFDKNFLNLIRHDEENKTNDLDLALNGLIIGQFENSSKRISNMLNDAKNLMYNSDN